MVALLSSLVFGVLRGRERHQKRRDFIVQAQQLAFSVESHFDVPLELLHTVVALFLSSDEVSREEFRTFVRPIIERHSSIYAFEWMPLIEDADRDRQVLAVRAEGFPEFQFQQKDSQGRLIPAARRPEYFPILYMEPLEPVILGLDVIGNPERGDESLRARNSGRPTASDRYSLIEDPDDVFSVISYEPVRKARPGSSDEMLVGLVGVLLRLEPVVLDALSSGGSEAIHLLLRDESAPEGKAVLFSSPGDPANLEAEMAWTHDFEFAERQWSARFTPRRDSTWALGHGPIALWGSGMLLAVLAAFGSGALLQIGHLRKRVDEAVELGQYRLGRRLGEGGMGIVYQAEHRMLARPAAIKLIRPAAQGGASGPEYQRVLERFEREVQATAALRSAHTIQVYDYGRTDGGEFYYVMELLDGLDLKTLVERNGPADPARVLHIVRQVCRSLAEAHAAGLVHRDIKPANIFLCRQGLEHDFVKVLDFGLVHADRADSTDGVTTTNPDTFMGTPTFCAPELIGSGVAVDGRSDIYSLGCVAYWMLTGRTVFEGKTPLAILLAHAQEEPRPPSAISEFEIPPDLEAAVLACLEKEPSRRPQSAEALGDRLEACAVAAAWTPARARRWWETHRPGTPVS